MSNKVGFLEVVCGSMFSGKSEELIRRIKRAMIANKVVQLFKPAIDDRYSEDEVVTHAGESLKAQVVKDAQALLASVNENTEVVGIDEVQFFNDDIINVIDILTKNGKRVVVAGLDMYASGAPFGPMGSLLAKAKYIDKLHAVCVKCGNDAYISHKTSDGQSNEESTVDVGSFGKYVALCENCRENN